MRTICQEGILEIKGDSHNKARNKGLPFSKKEVDNQVNNDYNRKSNSSPLVNARKLSRFYKE